MHSVKDQAVAAGRMKAVILIGPPGSGKGTLGKILAQIGGHVHLSSGEIFRGLSPDSSGGKLFHQYADKGLLLPDEATIQIWSHYVQGLIETGRFVPARQFLLLDGIPRTIKQAELLSSYLDVIKVIVLEMKNTTGLIARMKKRAVLENRCDDLDDEVLKTRLSVYSNETRKLIEFYSKELVATFNADQSKCAVLRTVLNGLSEIFP